MSSAAAASSIPGAERAADRSPAVQRSRARQVEQATLIIDAARRLIAERGERFTTQELVKEAGVALQTFYRIFAGKDQLLLAVFENLIAESCVEYEEAARVLPDPVARLRFYVTEAVRSVGNGSIEVGPRFVTAEHWRLHQVFPQEMAEATQPFTDLVCRQVELGVAEGLLVSSDPQRDAWFVTKLVMAVFHHYAYADAGSDTSTIADDLWGFCATALGTGPDRTPEVSGADTTDNKGSEITMGGTEVRRNSRRGVRVGLCLAVAALLATVGLTTVGGASVPAADEGVTGKTITLGYIYPATGVAASISQNGIKGFEARIARQNAEGGVNGRKIEYETVDDASSGANLTGAQDLVQNRHVFAVVNQSPFAFLSYRWLLDHGVPMLGAGSDGTYYQQKGNENVLSSGGNALVFGDLIYDSSARAMKLAGAKKVAALAYGAATSSVASAKAFMNYAVPGIGLDPVYTNTALEFGSSDVGPAVLGIKNAGADAVYLPMAAATNIAVVQGLQQSGVEMKASLLATGYGQDFLDSPAAQGFPSSVFFSTGYKPVELKTAETKKFQADLKKYADFTGVPDFGVYNGYILADLAIKGLEAAGKTPTRQGFIDGVHSVGMYDQAGLGCQPVDVSLAGRGKPPTKTCGYVLQVKDGKFVPFPKSGKPIVGKLVGTPEALAAAAAGTTATTVAPTTAAP